MTLPLHLLRQFNAVSEERGFTRAAAALHISQPAISKGVRDLEEQVGAPLIERGRGGIKLTAAGDVLAAYAREIFAIERAAERELRAIKGLDGGRLTVGASTTIANYHLPALLSHFNADHPKLDLRLIGTNTEGISAMLIERDLDVALVEGSVADPRIHSEIWRYEELVLIASPRHVLAQSGSPVTAADLQDDLILVREPGSGTRAEAERVLSGIGAQPSRTMEIGSTEAIKQMVAAGTGLSVIALAAVTELLDSGQLVVLPTKAGPFQRPLWQLRLTGARGSVAANGFQSYLMSERTPSWRPHTPPR